MYLVLLLTRKQQKQLMTINLLLAMWSVALFILSALLRYSLDRRAWCHLMEACVQQRQAGKLWRLPCRPDTTGWEKSDTSVHRCLFTSWCPLRPISHSHSFPSLLSPSLSLSLSLNTLSFPLTQHPVLTFGLACGNLIFSERSLVPPVGTLVLSCSGGLRLPLLPLPPFSSNAPSVVAITAYVCKLCVFLNRVWNDGAGMCQTEQCLTSNIMNCKTCTKVLIYCVLCVYKASGLVKGIFWVVCNLMSVESSFSTSGFA